MKVCLLFIQFDDFLHFFSALNSFVLQSQKFDAQIQCGSHVAKAWSVFVEETDRMSKNVKESADSMATTILEKLNSLYTVRNKKKTFLKSKQFRFYSCRRKRPTENNIKKSMPATKLN